MLLSNTAIDSQEKLLVEWTIAKTTNSPWKFCLIWYVGCRHICQILPSPGWQWSWGLASELTKSEASIVDQLMVLWTPAVFQNSKLWIWNDYRLYSPEGLIFSLEMKSTVGAPPVMFGSFTDDHLCVAKCLKLLQHRSKEPGSPQPLFQSYIKPHQ